MPTKRRASRKRVPQKRTPRKRKPRSPAGAQFKQQERDETNPACLAVAQWVAPVEPQITSVETEWRDLLDRERKHRARIFETLPTGGTQHRVAVRAWWGTVSEVLKGIQNVTDWHEHDLPYELLAMLAGQAAYLAVGQIPLTIKDVGGKGRTAPGPGEVSDIRWAVTYVYAVRDGRVRGRQPVAVVRRLYKLRDERTVRAWCRAYEPHPYLEAWTVSSLRNRVADAARRYCLNARTQKARTRAGPAAKTDFK